MQFKRGSNVVDEFHRGYVSPYLKMAAMFVDGYFKWRIGKPMVVICILRKPQRQIEICRFHGIRSDFQHCVGEAMDIRTSNLTEGERQAVIDYVNGILHKLCRLSFHNTGTGPHLHLNLLKSDKVAICRLIKDLDAQDCYARSSC